MEVRDLLRRDPLLWADLALVVLSLCCTTGMMQEMADGLSFGGFFILFVLVVLGIYFLALIGALVLLPRSIRSGRARFAAAAAVLQILGPIPWLWLIRAFGYPFSWFEFLMFAGMAAGAAALASLPFRNARNKRA